jgi:putative ABC transport system permease protein
MESLKTSLKAIFTNKVRAFLTMLGVIIGVFSVVTLSAIGNGVKVYINNQFETLGANSMYVQPGNDDKDDSGIANLMRTPNLLPKSLEKEILAYKQYVLAESPFRALMAKVSYRGFSKNLMLIGANEQAFSLMDMRAVQGREFTKSEVRAGKNLVVLGSEAAAEIFGEIEPLGKKIKINERSFQVIGILEEKGMGVGEMSWDDLLVAPLESVLNFVPNPNEVDEYMIKTINKDILPEAKEVMEKRMRELVKDEEVSIIDQEQVMSIVDDIMGVLTAGLTGIAAISLVVGGIGIMNIMLVSVTERTREIGLRKALGATPNAILIQFLLEALFLSVTGGMVGIVLAWLTTLAAQSLFPVAVSLSSVALAFFVSLAVGLFFGVMPARRAAKLSPIEALRYE